MSTATTSTPRRTRSIPLLVHSTYWRSKHCYRWKYLPLLAALVLALLLRVWLIAHTGGVLDGDEATVGIQAEHILRGERPVYFYGQANMGSLEAYLIAILFSLFGVSVWTLRLEPALLSLLLVWATWRFATMLADGAQLQPRARQYFRSCAVFLAAIAPLYDAVVEMRTLGGYIEIFIVMLLLLLCTFRLTQRWKEGSRLPELAWRWAGIGFLLGLAFWINPFAISAVSTIAVWLVVFCLLRGISWLRDSSESREHALPLLLKNGAAVLGAIPAACVGALPALIWGAGHNWENITAMTGRAGSATPSSMKMLSDLYFGCVYSRVVGGTLPGERHSVLLLHKLPYELGEVCLIVTGIAILLSLFWHHPILVQARKLTLMPGLFALFSYLFFLISWTAPVHCRNRDIIGRYASPLALVLPFFIAMVFTLIDNYLQERKAERLSSDEQSVSHTEHATRLFAAPPTIFSVGQLLLVALLGATLCSQVGSYLLTNPGLTFQSPFCRDAPANDAPIIAYMQREHIQYAWATMWVAIPITFKTQEHIIVAEPRPVFQYAELVQQRKATATDQGSVDNYIRNYDERLPQYAEAVYAANRPSLLVLARQTSTQPEILRMLDSLHITYRSVSFPSETGVNLLVITPLNRSITLSDWATLSAVYNSCPSRYSRYDVPDVP